MATSLLEFVHARQRTVGEILPDAVLTRCRVRPSCQTLWPLVEQLRRYPFSQDDVRFVIRAMQQMRWTTGGSARLDSAWRLTPMRARTERKPRFQFNKDAADGVDPLHSTAAFAIGSVHRPYWRALPSTAYSNGWSSRILTTDRLTCLKKSLEQKTKAQPNKTTAAELGESRSLAYAGQDSQRASQREVLSRRANALLFREAFAAVQRRFNQRVAKRKSPDTIPVVDRPAPTLTDPERRVSFEMRRMVPTIHWQRYRGMELREKREIDQSFAIYWFDSHYPDILASLAEMEIRLVKKGVRLPLSELGKPSPQELKDLRGRS